MQKKKKNSLSFTHGKKQFDLLNNLIISSLKMEKHFLGTSKDYPGKSSFPHHFSSNDHRRENNSEQT